MHLRPCRARVRLHGGMGPGGRFQPFALASVLRRHHAEPRLALHRHRRHRHHVRPVQGAGPTGCWNITARSSRSRPCSRLTVVLNAALHQLWDAPMAFGILSWALYGVGDGVLCIAWCAYLSLIPTTAHGRRRDGRIGGRDRAVRAGRRLVARGAESVRHGAAAAGVLAVLVFLFRQIAAPAINEAKGYAKALRSALRLRSPWPRMGWCTGSYRFGCA